jgi:hypothetical protein
MFESFEEAERRRGLQGFLDRHVKPPCDAARAEEAIQRIGIVFLSLAGVSGIIGLTVYRNPGSLGTGLVLGLAALALYWSRSRTAALILLGLVLANALLHLRAPFSWVWVALAVRAVQVAFVYQRLRKALESPS